jgi:hypothetical protein
VIYNQYGPPYASGSSPFGSHEQSHSFSGSRCCSYVYENQYNIANNFRDHPTYALLNLVAADAKTLADVSRFQVETKHYRMFTRDNNGAWHRLGASRGFTGTLSYTGDYQHLTDPFDFEASNRLTLQSSSGRFLQAGLYPERNGSYMATAFGAFVLARLVSDDNNLDLRETNVNGFVSFQWGEIYNAVGGGRIQRLTNKFQVKVSSLCIVDCVLNFVCCCCSCFPFSHCHCWHQKEVKHQ